MLVARPILTAGIYAQSVIQADADFIVRLAGQINSLPF